MSEVILNCGHAATPTETTAGYAVTADDRRICYTCAADMDRERARQGLPVYAYLKAVPSNAAGKPIRYYVQTWAGVELGTALATSTYPVRSAFGSEMICVRATIEGHAFYGRGLGDGMCITLRASKRK